MRQLVYLVFERVVAEDEQISKSESYQQRGPVNLEELKVPSGTPPKGSITNLYLILVSVHLFSANKIQFCSIPLLSKEK